MNSTASSHATDAFTRQAATLFIALRAGDAVGLAAGLWFVPRYVTQSEIGAVLPVTTFATLVATPIFAFAMTVMKETADLRGQGERGRMKSLLVGVFAFVTALTVLTLAVLFRTLPRYAESLGIRETSVGLLAAAAALLGCCAPVFTDALQGLKRFGALGSIEFAAAALRCLAMVLIMPGRALVGYFAGNLVQPLVREVGSLLALRRELSVPAERYWTHETVLRLARRLALTFLSLAVPFAVATIEQTVLRTRCTTTDSAGYYLATRLSDLLYCLTLPLLFVLFPCAADAERTGRSSLPLVARSCAVTFAAAILLGLVLYFSGGWILDRMPHADIPARTYAGHLPTLLAITALTAAQTFYTNAEIAAGRFSFLLWFIPLNAAFALGWKLMPADRTEPLESVLQLFLAAAALRFLFAVGSALTAERRRRKYHRADARSRDYGSSRETSHA